MEAELDCAQMGAIVRPLSLVHRGRDRRPPAASALLSMLRKER